MGYFIYSFFSSKHTCVHSENYVRVAIIEIWKIICPETLMMMLCATATLHKRNAVLRRNARRAIFLILETRNLEIAHTARLMSTVIIAFKYVSKNTTESKITPTYKNFIR